MNDKKKGNLLLSFQCTIYVDKGEYKKIKEKSAYNIYIYIIELYMTLVKPAYSFNKILHIIQVSFSFPIIIKSENLRQYNYV